MLQNNNTTKVLYFNSDVLLYDVIYCNENEDIMVSCENEQANIYDEVVEKYVGPWDIGIDYKTYKCIDKDKNWKFHQKFKNEILNMRKAMISKTLLTFTKRIVDSGVYVDSILEDIQDISYYIPESLYPLYNNEEIYDIDELNNDLDNKAQNESGDRNYMDFILPMGSSYYPTFSENISIIEFILNNDDKIILINKEIIDENNSELYDNQKLLAQYNNVEGIVELL